MIEERKYVLPESILIDLLEASMVLEMYDRDGIDNWPYAGENFKEVIKDFYPEALSDDDIYDITFVDCARARLEAGEFPELFDPSIDIDTEDFYK